MKIFRAIVWSEEILPDNRPQAKPGDVVVVRSREQFFIQTPSQAEAVHRFKSDIGRLASPKA